MSGVMVKMAVYGLVRVLVDWTGRLPLWFGLLVVSFGALSAVGGVLYALFQRELKRLLAFSSIENVGIITLGLGACLLLRARGDTTWAALALAAALLHTLNHALFKSLLFLAAGAVERSVGWLDLDRLGGLRARMPWTVGALVAGSLAISGLPPFNGFVSEWLTLQALLHLPRDGGLTVGLGGAVALAALAVGAALAVFCFVKVVGLLAFGPARNDAAAVAEEAPLPMRVAVVSLATGCLALGLVPGFLIGTLARLAPWRTHVSPSFTLSLPSTGSLPVAAIALALTVLTATLLLLRRRGTPPPAAVPAWASGQLPGRELAWSGAGFTKSMRLALEFVLRPERQITVRRSGGITQEVSYRGHVPNLLEERLYPPVLRVVLRFAAVARRLQSGRLGTYVGYLIALVLVLLVAAKVGLIG
jgi:hydrogenase-4 component B